MENSKRLRHDSLKMGLDKTYNFFLRS